MAKKVSRKKTSTKKTTKKTTASGTSSKKATSKKTTGKASTSKKKTSKVASVIESKIGLTHEDIAREAHMLWLARGGNAEDNWYEAERLLRTRLETQNA
jgi:hypothetical protein